VKVRVGSVFTEVLFLVVSVCVVLVFWTVLEDVDLQFLARHHLEVVHSLGGHLGFGVVLELDNRVSLVLTRVGVFWELNGVNAAKRTEPLSDVLLTQGAKIAGQAADIDSVVLLSLLVLVAGSESISYLGQVVLVLLLIFSSGGGTVLLSLRSLDHDGLSLELLVGHREGHED